MKNIMKYFFKDYESTVIFSRMDQVVILRITIGHIYPLTKKLVHLRKECSTLVITDHLILNCAQSTIPVHTFIFAMIIDQHIQTTSMTKKFVIY